MHVEEGDRVAGGALLESASFLVVKVLPLIPSLLAEYIALQNLVDAVMDALGEIFLGIGDALKAPFRAGGGIVAILQGVFDGLLSMPGAVFDLLTQAISGIAKELGAAFDRIFGEIAGFAASSSAAW